MPVVQQYGAPKVSNNALPDTRQSFNTRGAFGEAIGAGLQDAAYVSGAIADDMQKQEDAAAIKEATSQLRKEINQVTYLDEGAYYNLKGKAAYDGYQGTLTELEKRQKQIAEKLSPRQRDQFSQVAMQYVDREADAMSRHAAQGRTTWLNEQDESIIMMAQEDGSLRWNDNAEYAGQIKKSIQTLAKRNGWTPEKTELVTTEKLSAMHKSAIDNIIQQNPNAAKDYFESHKEEITPSMRDDIQTLINDQVDAQWVLEQGDAIRMSGGSLTARLNQARELTPDDPERRKHLTAQIENDYRLEQAAEREAQVDAYDMLTRYAIDEGMSPSQLRKNFPGQWAVLSASQRSTLSKPQSATTKTDLNAYYQYHGLMAQGDKEGARDFYINNSHLFSHSDGKSIIKELQSPAEVPSNLISDKSAFDTAVEGLLGKEPTKGESRKNWNRKYTVLAGMYQTQLQQYKDENQVKNVPEQDRRRILDELQITALRKDTLFGIDFLNPDENVSINDIPAEQLEAIRNELEKQGYAVTPEAILNTYTSDNWKEFWQN